MQVSKFVRLISPLPLVVVLLLWVSVVSATTQAPPAKSSPAKSHGESNGVFSVAVLRDGTWQVVGELSFDQHISLQQIDLSSFAIMNPAQVRISHKGMTAAHIDMVTLGGQTPSSVLGASESPALVNKKLARMDYDIIDASGKTLTFTFDLKGQTPVFAVAARIEPEQNAGQRFVFPISNQNNAIDSTSQFYSYRLNGVLGTLKMNGDLNEDNLGEPFFKEWSQHVTGHPSNYTYAWVRNDASNLFIAIDFVPDNADSGSMESTVVYIKTATGVMRFKVSAPEKQWGVSGFIYTDKAVYQHKVYEYMIPLSQIGANAERDGTVELAFEAFCFEEPPPSTSSSSSSSSASSSSESSKSDSSSSASSVAASSSSASSSLAFNSSSSSVAPVWAGKGPAPKNSYVMGNSGGSFDSPGGDSTVTVPAGILPAGSHLDISQPYQNGLPRGTFVLRGDGDHWDAVSVTDANGNPVYSFAPPGLTFCFNLSASEVANANGPLTIQMWDGGKWVDVNFTFTAGTPNKFCTTFTSL